MRVTDLEDFVLKQIYRPYQNTLFGTTDMRKFDWLSKDYNVDTVLDIMRGSPQWTDVVLGRVKSLEVVFPKWIKHEFVDYLVKNKYARQEKI